MLWVQVLSFTQDYSGYSVVRLTHLVHFVFNDCNRFLASNICESRGGATLKSNEKRKMETADRA